MMHNKQKYSTLAVLFAATVALGLFLPMFLDETPRDIQSPFYFTPRPTSTRFSSPPSNIVDVFNEPRLVEIVERTDTNCTYPLHYWQDHPETWPAEIIIGQIQYTRDDMRAMFSVPDPEAQVVLIRQVYGAFLNILHGSNMAVIEPVIIDAVSWLESNPPGSNLSEFNRQQGMYMTGILAGYNNGEVGPGLCKGAPGSPTPTRTPTLTWTPPPPSSTPVPVVVPALPGPTNPPPSNEPPTNPPPPPAPEKTAAVYPTSTQTSLPTATPLPTTSPQPTITLKPTAFPTPTLSPVPSNTPQPTSNIPTQRPPTHTPKPTNTITPTPTPTPPPEPTETPPPEGELNPTSTPRPTNTPKPTKTPKG
jgi:hypothetical protein